jgi:hypothetical protein
MYRSWRHGTLTVALLLASGFGARPAVAAPALKTPDPAADGIADLTAAHALMERAVEAGKLAAADERRLLDTVRQLQATLRKAADLPAAELPVGPDGLDRGDLAKAVRQANVRRTMVVAGDVEGTVARDAIILASGTVKFTILERCVVLGHTVRFTRATACVIAAAEFVRGTGVDPGPGGKAESIIVAGKWLRATSVSGAVCHIRRPGDDPAPDDPKAVPAKAIRLTQAKGVIFLNRPDDVATNGKSDCRWVEMKSPPVK